MIDILGLLLSPTMLANGDAPDRLHETLGQPRMRVIHGTLGWRVTMWREIGLRSSPVGVATQRRRVVARVAVAAPVTGRLRVTAYDATS